MGYHDFYQEMEIMTSLEEISTLTGYHGYIGRYHDSCGDIIWGIPQFRWGLS